jgi:Skp family chaperone for outer membrane proteins
MFTPNLDSVLKQFNKTLAGLESLEAHNKERGEKLGTMIDSLAAKRADLESETRKIEDIKSTLSTLLK